jgi:hypothetical protein
MYYPKSVKSEDHGRNTEHCGRLGINMTEKMLWRLREKCPHK